MLLRMRRKITRAMKRNIATKPPKYIIRQTMAQMPKATPAVINHPPMTESTPVTRNTALSRLQARSASDVPIATIKVTYVVDNGNLYVVPITISTEASTRFTAARTTSKAAPSASMASSLRKRVSSHWKKPRGTTLFINSPASCAPRTILRAAREEPNISSPSS